MKINKKAEELMWNAEEWEKEKARLKQLKMEREKEELVIDTDIDEELDVEDETVQKRIYENTKDDKYWVTEYKVTTMGEEDKIEIIKSTEVIGLENAEKMLDGLEEIYADKDDILVYIEEFDNKGILAT